jgi:hypothetical protein
MMKDAMEVFDLLAKAKGILHRSLTAIYLPWHVYELFLRKWHFLNFKQTFFV